MDSKTRSAQDIRVEDGRADSSNLPSKMPNTVSGAIDQINEDDAGHPAQEMRYASWWIRLAALCVDSLNLFVIETIVLLANLLPWAYILLSMFLPGSHLPMPQLLLNQTVIATVVVVNLLIILLLPWLYTALHESSELQTTPGKRMFGLKVVDASGKRITFGRATYKYFMQGLCLAALSSVWVAIGAVAARLSGSYAPITMAFYLAKWLLMPVVFGWIMFGGRQTFLDRMTNRYIVYEDLAKIEPLSQTEPLYPQFAKRIALLLWGAAAWFGHFFRTIFSVILLGLVPLAAGFLVAFGEAWYGMECVAVGAKSIFQDNAFLSNLGALPDSFTPQLLIPGIENYYSNFYTNLGNFQSAILHDYDGACRSYDKALTVGVNLPGLAEKEIWLAKEFGRTSASQNKYSGEYFRANAVNDAGTGSAALNYNLAVVAGGRDPVPLVQRAQYYVMNGHYWEAIQDCETAKRMSNCPEYAHALLAHAWNKVGNFYQANAEADRCLQVGSQKADGYAAKAFIFVEHKPVLAMAQAGHALAADPGNPYALAAVARVYSQQKRYEDAQSFAESSIKEEPRAVDGYLELGRAYLGQARYTDAVKVLTKSLELSPNEVVAFALRASALRKLDKPFDAVLDEQKANYQRVF